MTGIAADHLRSFIERILRLKEEQDALGADIRDIYTEAKAMGFDKTVMGRLVTYLRKRAKDSAAQVEADALFDLYLHSYDEAARPSHTHARARKVVAKSPRIVKVEPFDEETGEILEDRAGPPPAPPAPVPPAADDGGTHPLGETTNEGEDDAKYDRTASEFQASSDLIDDGRRLVPKRGGDETPPGTDDQANDGRDTLAPTEKTSGVASQGGENPAPIPPPDATPAGAVVAERSGVTAGREPAPPSQPSNVRSLAPHFQTNPLTNAPIGELPPDFMRRTA